MGRKKKDRECGTGGEQSHFSKRSDTVGNSVPSATISLMLTPSTDVTTYFTIVLYC